MYANTSTKKTTHLGTTAHNAKRQSSTVELCGKGMLQFGSSPRREAHEAVIRSCSALLPVVIHVLGGAQQSRRAMCICFVGFVACATFAFIAKCSPPCLKRIILTSHYGLHPCPNVKVVNGWVDYIFAVSLIPQRNVFAQFKKVSVRRQLRSGRKQLVAKGQRLARLFKSTHTHGCEGIMKLTMHI